MTTETNVQSSLSEGNSPPDEVNPVEEQFEAEQSEGEQPEEEAPSAELSSEDDPFEDNSDDEESEDNRVEDLPMTELVVSPLVKEEPRVAGFSANTVRGFDQRFLPIRFGVSDNGTRSSRKRPMSKHLTIGLPDGWSRIFPGVWVAERQEDAMIFVSLFARSDQDARTGYKGDCPWKWYRVKANDEVAIGVSRGYTLSRRDDVLIHDYDVGAFRLHLPHEPEPSDHGAVQLHRPMFG